MIKTQELKSQIEELSKQNDIVLIELEQVKRMLLSQVQNQEQSQQQGNQQGGGQNGGQGQQQAYGEQQQKQGQEQGGQGQSQAQGQNQNHSSQQGNQISQLVSDFMQIKGLVETLEQKTGQYVSNYSSGGSLTEKDVVNLVLTLINGMVDWASEFVSSKEAASSSVQ